MLLTVDVGNTNTTLGLFDGDELFDTYRVKTDPRATADELALLQLCRERQQEMADD